MPSLGAFEPTSSRRRKKLHMALFSFPNVTCINAAVSDESAFFSIAMPVYETGLRNYCQAHLTNDTGGSQVLPICLDALNIPQKVSLVKIDVEGHEAFVLHGMVNLLQRDHPILIVETRSPEVEANLCSMGYMSKRFDGSPNILFQHKIHQ
jgi:FkbM family methyltransferase